MTVPQVGDAIAPLTRRPTAVQLFLFSAATWNAHRIHYDAAHARAEGYQDVLVQSHLHACFLDQAVRDACGPEARLRRFGWQNRAAAVPGDVLTVTGEVSSVERTERGFEVAFALEERNQRGELCTAGWATAVLDTEGGR